MAHIQIHRIVGVSRQARVPAIEINLRVVVIPYHHLMLVCIRPK